METPPNPQGLDNLDDVHQELANESFSLRSSIVPIVALIVVVVVLLGGLAWYALSTWFAPSAPVIQGNQNSAIAVENTTPQKIEPITVETEGVGTTQIIDEETRRKLAEDASATLKEAQLLAGQDIIRPFGNQLSNHIEHIRKLRNYLFINVQTLLQGNSNKEKLLSDYMNTLLAETKRVRDDMAKIRTDLVLLKTDLSSYEADQKRYGDAYKQGLANYDPIGTSENLELYISSQSMAAETHARVKALESTATIFSKLLETTETKMKFIAANKEALLKEVQVVDIKSIEERLILDEKEWLQGLQ